MTPVIDWLHVALFATTCGWCLLALWRRTQIVSLSADLAATQNDLKDHRQQLHHAERVINQLDGLRFDATELVEKYRNQLLP